MSGLQIQTATATKFRAIDPVDSRWFIEGVLDCEGVLSFEVFRDDGNDASPHPGYEFFQVIMDHFGEAVQLILGQWTNTRGFDANLRIFNEKTLKGMSEMEAAFQTKTGVWVKRHGFTRVQNLDARPENSPGGYEQVLVEFGK